MKKTIIAAILVAFTLSTSVAQKLRTYAKLVYVKTQTENPDVTVIIEAPVANDKQLKFKLKIVNKTNDYIIFKPAESKLVVNGKEWKPNPSEKELIINPLDDNFRVINIFGEGFNSARTCTYSIDGIFKVASKGNSVEAVDFKLPVSKYDFAVGNFNVSNTKVYKESDATKVDFKVSYTGTKVGCVFFTNATVLMPDGNEYSSIKPKGGLLNSRPGMVMMQKGGTDEFTLNWDRMEGGKAMDMQKVPMIIKWHETFCEITPLAEPTLTLNLEIDETQSK